jgi:4-hydroxy-tetrahydrodipicolinate reductase
VSEHDIKLGLFGAQGRMGRRIASCVSDHSTLDLIMGLDEGDTSPFAGCDVVIDFSVAEATEQLVSLLEPQTALVTGVTGRSLPQQQAIEARATTAPVFIAANFSLGIALLDKLSREAARILGPSFDPEIFESHHRRKVDAPSGTALHLAQAVAESAHIEWPAGQRNRMGVSEPRTTREIGISSLRGGDVVGDHTVFFFGPSERIELTHRATDRDVFAHGALRAAAWVARRQAGLYGMDAMLSDL